jgi:dihydroorotate dehydrogenase electron transfer subunit
MMRIYSEDCVLVERNKISVNGYMLTFGSVKISGTVRAGQFVEVMCGGGCLLRRPFSVCSIGDNSFTLFIKMVGKGTKWLCDVPVGSFVNVIGPLGNDYPLVLNEKVLLLGGGCGVASLYMLARELHEKSNLIDMVYGFGSPAEIPETLMTSFGKYASRLVVTTDRGNYPVNGNVIDAMEKFKMKGYDRYYICGPLGMMKGLSMVMDMERSYVSMEARMACGVGVCYGCSINMKDGTQKRVCTDGPIFRMTEVDWNGL